MTETSKNIISAIKEYGSRLFGFIRNRVNNDEDAEDILQEVWYQLSRVIDLEDIENISGWLFRVARNRITDQYRKNKPQLLEDLTFEDEEGNVTLSEILLGGDLPNDQLLADLFWEELNRALDELPDNQKIVFVKNELEGMTLQEIADDEDEKLKTVISRKGYAVKHLRKRLQTLYEELKKY